MTVISWLYLSRTTNIYYEYVMLNLRQNERYSIQVRSGLETREAFCHTCSCGKNLDTSLITKKFLQRETWHFHLPTLEQQEHKYCEKK